MPGTGDHDAVVLSTLSRNVTRDRSSGRAAGQAEGHFDFRRNAKTADRSSVQ
jgi:hypothetical protein